MAEQAPNKRVALIINHISGATVVVDTNRLHSPQPLSAGQSVTVVTPVGGKPNVHGQISGTTVIVDNSA